MRGLLNLLTNDVGSKDHSTGVFVTTAEPTVISVIVSQLSEQFPNINFTYLMPQAYPDSLRSCGKTLYFEDLKKAGIRSFINLRRSRFDVCIVVLAGNPSFRKWKLVAFFTNVRRIFIYSDDHTFYALDRAHWRTFYRHLASRHRRWLNSSLLFFPIGFLYLLARTGWILYRGRFRNLNTKRKAIHNSLIPW
jgi:hypothetical protein